ncbi:MAG: DUF2723 domain-containing protein [Tidjanibacter sp.]|nr:DUF2723 domain-containing protein [Tidjanibacter sp.]
MKDRKQLNTIIGWLTFLLSGLVYLLTVEPSASLWDCGEFIATSYKLEVGHPPGAPLFMLIARFFAMFAPSPEFAALAINIMSVLCSALTIMFLFWTITHLGRRLTGAESFEQMSSGRFWTVMGAGFIGSLAYAFTDSFWFSAVEAEVYAMSSLFTAVVFWAILKWEQATDNTTSTRWLVLIAYLMGLSIGVHILNLLTIPALVFIYYFKKYPQVTTKGVIYATAIAGALLFAINSLIIPYTTAIGAWFDRLCVNTFGLPVNVGFGIYAVVLFVVLFGSLWFTHRKGNRLANTIMVCLTMIMIGYSSYASVIIRAAANPPMNSNDPDNPYSLLYLLNRDQYGAKPIVTGYPFTTPMTDFVYEDKYYVGDDGKYQSALSVKGYIQPEEFKSFFPRMWADGKDEGYRLWSGMDGSHKVTYAGREIEVPSFGDNMRFFFNYQLNFMYWRYFLWNFVGRQSDNQSTGEVTDGQWLSGIKPIDEMFLGPQDLLPASKANNKGRNTYFFLPFILGLIGLFYQLNRDPKNFTVVMLIFFMIGFAQAVYHNMAPGEPRERDYVFVGSFYAFAMWIGLGVMKVEEWIASLTKGKNRGMITATVATLLCACVPVILLAQNWDDHDRSGRYVMRDAGYNYLEGTLPNSIVINYGDNDTYPLWYNQEVEGVRPDVRIMNQSYLGGGWYIEEMKHRYNESEAIPFQMPRHKYMFAGDFCYVQEIYPNPIDIKQAMAVVYSDSPATRVNVTDRMAMDLIPARKLLLPVNKENVLKTGVVRPEDADLILDTITLELKGETISKPEVMILDLLANWNWERPIYFTQPSLLQNIGLLDYLQYDGYAYRFVPIKTKVESSLEIGRIDVDYLYTNLMEKFRYGNVADPDVYVDNFSRYNIRSVQIRLGFARLAMGLLQRGDKEGAVEVLDRGLEVIPLSQVGWGDSGNFDYEMLAYIDAYYLAGETERGDELLLDFATDVAEHVLYYSSFPESRIGLVAEQLDTAYSMLAQLYMLAEDSGRTEIANELKAYFE